MYNDTIKAENKIISSESLMQIFQAMGELLKKYQKISMIEEQQNRMLDYDYQSYTFKDEGSKMKVVVDFYDDTNITFDNYDNFASVFYSRIDEIKYLDLHYNLYYSIITPQPNKSKNYYSQSINMTITENKMDITLNLSSQDHKLDDIYNLIKSVILNAPVRYDMLIKKKGSITNTVIFASGMIPAMFLTTILLFIPAIKPLFFNGYVVYPLCCAIFSYFIGSIFSLSKLDDYYKPIMPEKKYAGYSDGKSIYKDDIDKYVGASEILIGKKVNNLSNREYIKEEYDKHKKLIPIELIVLLIMSFVVICIGIFFPII